MSLAAAIEKASGALVQIVPGKVGQFDVEAGGRVIFSKQAAGRFPGHDEVLAGLASITSP